ncbi:hypothetical protein [Komagataeibacter europaeus]|uniref:hypothetical protein n=1 Tax=Komagataeibacter europaeus TaxID=33995 RepID=UPI000B56B6B2|nr:hypothetical protein [Komagataeibacter europaeus]ARW17736.1 hypothetical protein S101446_02644 [Komagataeibacter europaeus]
MGIAILSFEPILAFLIVFLAISVPFLLKIILYTIRGFYNLFIYFISGEYKKDMEEIDREEEAKAEAAKKKTQNNRGFEDEIRKKYNL